MLGLSALALWIVAGPWKPENPLVIALLMVYFGASSLGGFWMMYRAIRYERHPLARILLAFVPYSFLWYYFERVRPLERLKRNAVAP